MLCYILYSESGAIRPNSGGGGGTGETPVIPTEPIDLGGYWLTEEFQIDFTHFNPNTIEYHDLLNVDAYTGMVGLYMSGGAKSDPLYPILYDQRQRRLTIGF